MSQSKPSNRVLLASLIGSSIEWFDYFLYGTVAALVFNQLFFPAEDPTVGTAPLLATFLPKEFNNSYVPIAAYIITGVISLIAVMAASDYSGRELND